MAFNLFQNQPIANKSVLPNFAEEYNKPQSLAAKLLEAQLKNKHDSIINQYLPRSEEARINNILANTEGTRSNTGLDSIRRKIMEAQANQATMEYQQNQAINDALSGGSTYAKPPTTSYDNSDRNVSADGPGIANSASAYDTFPGRRAPTSQLSQQTAQQPAQQPAQDSNIINQGNPELYSIDQLYDSNPLARMGLKKRGYEKKQETKYDPKTGVSSVITTYPSGKVTVNHSVPANSGFEAITAANRTKAIDTIMGVTNVLPTIDNLISIAEKGNVPGQLIGRWFQPDKQATYDSLANMSGDTLAKALGFPATDKGMEAALASIRRAAGESDKHYADRLKDYKKEMLVRLKNAKKFTNQGVSTTISSQSDPYDLGL